jgi:Porin subfamily
MEVEMKMVKSLLLGTAAGFVAVAGAQAADMPVKAAVQYVKICNLYGDGFYYLPGTGICVKVGGYVRMETAYNSQAGQTNWGPFTGSLSGAANSLVDGHDWFIRARAYISMDTREQTEYGILRTYINIGINGDFPTIPGGGAGSQPNFSGNRAFVQFAGFTVGLAQSFYDFYSSPITSYWGIPSSDTGDGGWLVAAYTATWGNGITSTVSLEQPRRITTIGTNATTDPFLVAAIPNNASVTSVDLTTAKVRFPDVVSDFRIDQQWGSAGIMFAAHDASAGYYQPTSLPVSAATAGCVLVAAGNVTGAEDCGHPANKVGWAAGFGFRINNITANGDYFQMQANYTKGAIRYVMVTQGGGGSPAFFTGGSLGLGWMADGVYSDLTGDVRLTTAYGINAAYDHYWTKQFKTSAYGFYGQVEYDSAANNAICTQQSVFGGNTAGAIGGAGAGAGSLISPLGPYPGISNCSNNWGLWAVGTRTQYNFTPAMYIGFDVLYWHLQTADKGIAFFSATTTAALPTGVYQIQDQGEWMLRVRFHRDILP